MAQTSTITSKKYVDVHNSVPDLTRNEPNKESTTLLWFDPNIGLWEDTELTKQQLRSINDFVTFHTDLDQCVLCIQSITHEKVFLIISGLKASQLLPSIYNLCQVDCIFIFCMHKERYEHLTRDFSKVVGIYTHLDELCSSIRKQIDLFDKQLETFSTFNHHQKSTKDLSKQSAEFLWFQLFHHLIIRLPRNQHAKERMMDVCRRYYRGNMQELNLIGEFEREYCAEDAIRWYSRESFLYKLVNKALRTEDLDQLQTFRFFISDLSKSLAREHEKILLSEEKVLTLYRGAKLDREEFEKLRENVGNIFSTNGYLSTTRSRAKAMNFTKTPIRNLNAINVLFQIECDIQQLGKSVIYADIASLSDHSHEQEILFDLNACFRLNSIKEECSIALVYMNASNEGLKIVEDYIDLTEVEINGKSASLVFGQLMCHIGQYDQSQKCFEELLDEPNGEDVAWIEFNFGQVLDFKGQWDEARMYYERAYNRMMTAKPVRMADSAQVINNIGGIHYRQGKYEESLDSHQRALKILEKYCPSNHVEVARSLNYIGLILDRQGEYDEALEYHQKTLKMRKKLYPSDHVEIAASLNNIAYTLIHQEKYDEALEYCQDALRMRERFYPTGHLDTAKSLNNIGLILERQKKYDEALEYHRRALQMRKKFYPSDHAYTATSLQNIGSILNHQGKYDEAFEYDQKALKMRERLFPSGHIDMAHSFNSIGRYYENQKKKQLALDYYERALVMMEMFLPPSHPNRLTTERDIHRVSRTT